MCLCWHARRHARTHARTNKHTHEVLICIRVLVWYTIVFCFLSLWAVVVRCCCELLFWSVVVIWCCDMVLWCVIVICYCDLLLWSVVVICCCDLLLWSVIVIMFLWLLTANKIPCVGELRLVSGIDNSSGFVEIYFRDTWGVICNHYWKVDAARWVNNTMFN